MARKKTTGPTPVEAIKHRDARANIPTADAEVFVDPATVESKQVHYARDPSLDPQLVWRGKDKQDSSDLIADAPPIYIQEKIDPQVLVENLRRTAERPDEEPELTLYDDFDGLDELSQVEFYQHSANWSNRMILGDSLNVMASLAERESLRGNVQMIYIDPPYGIKFGSNWQVSARKRDVKDGKLEDAAREAEQIKAFRDTWELGIHSYLAYLRDRLVVARDLLTETGSCFVQIGDENVHLVRSLMDEVFGSENFINQIAFKTTSGATSEFLGGTIDYILWFAKDREAAKFRPQYRSRKVGPGGDSTYSFIERPDGSRCRLSRAELDTYRPSDGRLYRLQILTSQGAGREKGEGAASWFPVTIGGTTYRPSMQARWKTNEQGMERLIHAGRVEVSGNSLNYVRFHDDFPAIPINNLWDDTQSGSGMDKLYVVQTNTKVVERCMLMCTDPGDLVLDPTCGSGTTAFVAEQWGRRWITIDTSRVALALARQRLMGAKFPYYILADSKAGRTKEAELTGKPVSPEPVSNDVRHGFVYERVQHITLKSIANNPDIKEEMTREEIDAAIKRHADFEYLYDRPYEDKQKVRVAGRFTVESLSPHRSLVFAGTVDEESLESISEASAAVDPDSPTFEQSILDNLAKAGIQNGRRRERIEFASVEAYAGRYIQAVGVRRDDPDSTRIGVAIGPQYGTVSAGFIKEAAREGIKAGDIDLLCVLAFAFDPQATGVTEDDGVTVEASDEGFANVAGQRRVGRIQVLMVRMNADLLIGENLKKTDSANLFTVFGEPDIQLDKTGDGKLAVNLRGVDVYDPTTGEVRSNDTGQIALWMIDTNYDETSFFVRHCYFTGGNDPYKKLKTALRADIQPDAWSALYRTFSLPFDPPTTGKIAVKVINDYGDEVMKVLEV
ncbi:site-specific DNA-methyltransferase [Mycobacterium hubeiense]|uniref:site-specific DNA-methyltransferase n=1 Tax=Mycobacterium hubeiense TaxID=1867256 RepID=UPI000C7F0806|nr:site-specific DNA-methyltransferase [Mycobacterium sp. QGD 101]